MCLRIFFRFALPVCIGALLILQARAGEVFPIASSASAVQICGGLAFDGTNYLAAIQSGAAVEAQLVSPAGAALGAAVRIGTNLSFPPAIAVANGGGFYLEAWSDNMKISSKGYQQDIYGQVISTAGKKVGGPFPLVASLGAHRFQTLQCLACGGGNFLAVWQDSLGDRIFGQLVTASATGGALTGPEFLISGQQGNGNSAAVAFNGTAYFVVWQSDNGGTVNLNNTFGAFVSTNGSVSAPLQISETASLDPNPLALAWNGTNYLVVWNKDLQHAKGMPTNWALCGRIVGPDGTFGGDELALETNPGSQAFPSLCFDGSQYLLAWSAFANFVPTTTATIQGQYLDSLGNPQGSPFTALPALAHGQGMFSFRGLVYDGGRFVLAATSLALLGSATNITRLTGGVVSGEFLPSSRTAPVITSQPSGTVVLAGTPAEFSVGAQGSAFTCQWRLNGKPMAAARGTSGIAGATLIISNAAVANNGSYSVVVSNLFGSVTSAIAPLTVAIPIVITAQSTPAKVAEITGAGRYYSGSNVTLTAFATNGCYNFVKWTVNGATVGTNPVYSFVPTASKTLVANFALETVAIQTSAMPANGGTVTAGGSKPCGSIVTLKATPAKGFQFSNWLFDNVDVGLGPALTFHATNSMSLVAVFVESGAATGLAPVSLSGLMAAFTGQDGAATNDISFGTGTFASVSSDITQVGGVGDCAYTPTSSNTATLILSDIAPPSIAGHRTTFALAFTNLTTAAFINSGGASGIMTFTAAPASAPPSLSGVTLAIPSTIAFADGSFTGPGTAGDYTYTRFSPSAGMAALTTASGVSNFLVLSFGQTNLGTYSAESASAGQVMESAGDFTVTAKVTLPGEIAPASLQGATLIAARPLITNSFSFGDATYGSTSFGDLTQPSGVANYTYTRLTTKTALLVMDDFIAPSSSAGASQVQVMLTFSDSKHAVATLPFETDAFTLLPSITNTPASLAGKTLTLSGNAGVISLGDGAFKWAGAYGTYSYNAYGPIVAMAQLTYTDSSDAGLEDYLQLVFLTTTAGEFYNTQIDSTGHGIIKNGTFTAQ